MQQDSTVPQIWLVLSNAVTAFLTVITTLTAVWFRRKREPAEVAKIKAETANIHVTTGLEGYREMQAVIDKAEARREEWLRREEELRTQIRFWRNQAEELDGQLIDSRDANGALRSKLARAEDDARAAQIFVEQINMAAKLTVCEHHPSGVRLSDFTPLQLNPPKSSP